MADHPAQVSPPPATLPYDDLPPGSDVRREYTDDGGVKIIVPAGEPPPAVMKQTFYDALASAAPASWALLLLSFVLFYAGLRNNRISGPSLVWAWGFFAVFCTALVLLVAWVRYGMMLDSVRRGREQMTVIAATPARLLIETAGPFGAASYDFAPDRIAGLAIRRGVIRDELATPRRVLHLALSLRDGRTILVLPGRDDRELTWACAAIRRTMRLAGG